MTLEDSLKSALGLTRDLSAALAGERLDHCLDLLNRRREALQTFERLHRAASPAAKQAVGDLVLRLQADDRDLQIQLEAAMETTGAQLRQSMAGQANAAPLPSSQGRTPGSIDRKA